MRTALLVLLAALLAPGARRADSPVGPGRLESRPYVTEEHDFVVHDFRFASGETRLAANDANDLLYALESSRDYDPEAQLEKIRAPLLAINSADDFVNPPELGILERLVKRVPRGRAVIIPTSDATRGHGTHTWAAVWEQELRGFLKE